jgi:hypothetical protein
MKAVMAKPAEVSSSFRRCKRIPTDYSIQSVFKSYLAFAKGGPKRCFGAHDRFDIDGRGRRCHNVGSSDAGCNDGIAFAQCGPKRCGAGNHRVNISLAIV